MKRVNPKLIVVFLLFISPVFLSGAALAAPKRVLLKTPTCFSTALPGLGDTIVWIADNLKAASGGNIIMKVYEPGKLVPPFEILDAVSKGKVNAGYSAPAYWQGKIPSAGFFGAVPFGPEAPEYLAWFFQGNGLELFQEMYDQSGYNVKVLPACIIAPETSGWFSKPINSIEDLKGLRMRFAGLGGMAMQKLGVSVSQLPGGEIFPALEKGVLDATEFSMPAIDQRLGFHKIAKYNYFPGWHQQATVMEILINKKTWNSLEESQRKLIEMVSMAGLVQSLSLTEAIQGRVIKENQEQHGVKNLYWSEQMLNAFRKAWLEVVEEQSAKDPFFKKVWEDLEAFRKEYDYWESYGFLPRESKR
jgi:TRAP-type mannitol/chloroaromatic compound transport system substrate-binding protein